MIANIDWSSILHRVVEHLEASLNVSLVIDDDIVREIQTQADETVKSFKKERPNVAKVAGSVAFWIRKLKPISHHEDCTRKYLAINELAGLYVGIAICGRYFDNAIRIDFNKINPRVVSDWAISLRRNAHSPHGLVMAFEILASDLTH